jgi:hypothetical protein
MGSSAGGVGSAGGLLLMEGSSDFKEKSKFKMGLEEEKVENRNN